jgi:hypothetical protein
VHTQDFILAKSNIDVFLRSRGKIVGRREMHNIFVNLGRQHLAYRLGGELLTYVSQMGVGIGGFRQNNPIADLPPLDVYTPSTHTQTDTDPTVTALERAVRISGGSDVFLPTDVWLKDSAPPDHPASNRTRFICVFTELEISYDVFATVPCSEIGLFLNDKDTHVRTNQLIAYDAFDPIPKTTALEWEVRWTVIF